VEKCVNIFRKCTCFLGSH